MKKALLAAAVLVSLEASALAQSELQWGLGQARDILELCNPGGARGQAAKAKVDPVQKAVLTAASARQKMQEAAGTGMRLVDTLDQESVAVEIESTGGELCLLTKREVYPGRDRTALICDPALGSVSPRYAALLIAERAAELRWNGVLPDCAERDFIVSSLMARTWLELGGGLAALPSFDGRKDEARASRLKAWRSAKLHDYARAQAAKGRPTLDGMLETNASVQGTVLKEIRDLETKLSAANCASEERAIISEIEQRRAHLMILEKREWDLQGLKDKPKVFAREEDDWAKQNWRLLGAAPR